MKPVSLNIMLCLSVNMDEVKGMQIEVSGNQVLSIGIQSDRK